MTDIVFGTPTLFPDLGRSDHAHLRSVLDACAEAGCSEVSVFGSHLVQAIESIADGRAPEAFNPPPDRRSAIPAFRAALGRAPDVLGRPETSDVVDLFDSTGIGVRSIECLMAWAGADSVLAAHEAEAACALAERFGAAEIVAVCIEPSVGFDTLIVGLDLVAEIASRHGRSIVVEWLPGTGLASLASTIELLKEVGRSNIGLVVDAVHWQCQPAGPAWDLLDSVDPAWVRQLQLSDCRLPVAEGVVEPRDRSLPGHGDVELVRLITALKVAGANPVVTCEVFNEDLLMRLGVAEFARRQVAASRAVVALAGVG